MTVVIFCKVVDNFGDAGFCLRLAMSLATRVEVVRVYCDDLALIKKMFWFNRDEKHFMPKNLVLCDYGKNSFSQKIPAANLVIETFHAEPPLIFLEEIHGLKGITRVIVDHLTTEKWSDSFQNTLAPDYKLLKSDFEWIGSSSAERRWLAPGFSSKSSGLITGGWKKINNNLRNKFRSYILKSKDTKIKKNNSKDLGLVFVVCMFLYEVNDIFIDCPVPDGFDSLALWQPKSIVMNQSDFDCALQACDFNFVRGEDSFLSAHNAAASQWMVPFVWQPYLEKNDGHIRKFEGWRKIFPEFEFDSYWQFANLIVGRNNLDFKKKWANFTLEWSFFRTFFHHNCVKIMMKKSLEKSLLDCVENKN